MSGLFFDAQEIILNFVLSLLSFLPKRIIVKTRLTREETVMTRTRKTGFILIGLLLILLLLPVHQVHAARATGTVKNRVLNVRTSASTSSAIVCKLSQGTKVTIISETTGTDGMKWYNVYFAYNGGTSEGYVRADLLNVSGTVSESTTTVATTSSASGTLYVDKTSVRVREKAEIGSTIVAGLEKGAEVKVQGTATGSDGKSWTKVSFTKDGRSVQGYIRSDLLTSVKPADSSSASTTTNDGDILYVNADAVRVRSNVSESADIVANLLKGDQVKQKSVKTGADGKPWTKVSFTINGTKYSGYIRSDLLTASNTSGSSSSSSSDSDEILYVTATAVRVREHASSSAEIVTNLLKGDQVKQKSTKTGDDGKQWTKVSVTINGTKFHGYIRSDYLSGTKTSDSGTSTAATATTAGTNTKTVRPAVVNVRSRASTSGSISAKLSQGSKVAVLSETTGSDGKKWSNISCTTGGKTVTGYIRSDLLN